MARKRSNSRVASCVARGGQQNIQNKRQRQPRRSGSAAVEQGEPSAIVQDARISGEGQHPSVNTQTQYNCTICLDSSRWKKMKQLQCGHQFHQVCIYRWLNQKRQCPLCHKTATSPAFLQVHSASQGGINQQFRITNEGSSPRVGTRPAVVQVPSGSQGGTHQQFQITNEGSTVRMARKRNNSRVASCVARGGQQDIQNKRQRQPRRSGSAAVEQGEPSAIVQDASISGEGQHPSVNIQTQYNCTICLDSSRWKKMKQLKCGHQFHQVCIYRWLNQKRQCPLCHKTATSPAFLQVPSASQGGNNQQFRITNEGRTVRMARKSNNSRFASFVARGGQQDIQNKRQRQPRRSGSAAVELGEPSAIVQDASISGEGQNPSVNTQTQYNCTICLDSFRWKIMTQLQCGHQFHQVCINKWLNQKRQCPLCRKTVKSPAFLQVPSASQEGIHQQFRITNEGRPPTVGTRPAVVQVPSGSQGGTHQQFQITNEGMSPRVRTLPAVVQVPSRSQGGTHQQFRITKEEDRSLSVAITATALSFPWLLFQKFVSWPLSFWKLRIF